MSRVVRVVVLGLLAGLAGAGSLRAQDDELPEWKLDPYTRNERQALDEAGYVALGTYHRPWGDDHGTGDVEELLGQVEIRWVETAHFRIGSSLPEHKLTQEDKAALQAELKRLARRVPRVKPTTRVLDPWLRLHLYAQRLEELYAEVSEVFGVGPDDFPPAPPDGEVAGAPGTAGPESAAEQPPRGGTDAAPPEPDRGEGPYLGQRDKFLVLLLETKSSLGRYARKYGGITAEAPVRLNMPNRGSLLFGTALEFFDERATLDERVLHSHVVWCVVQDLAQGYKAYRHLLPRWWAEGLGHWFARRVAPEHSNFGAIVETNLSDLLEQWDWPPKVRARVKQDYYTPVAEMLAWPLDTPLTFADTMLAWSRVDYLLSEHRPGSRVFMDVLKDPIPSAPGTAPSYADVLQRQEAALQAAFGFDAAGFEAAWAEWVLRTYPKN